MKATRLAVARGLLTPTPCQHCGASKVEGHHEDYSKPLMVVWLCRPCHARHHQTQRAALVS